MMTIQVMKTVSYQVPNGELKIWLKDGSWRTEYHNKIYKGSPFKGPQYGDMYSIDEIMRDSDMLRFLSRFE